MKNKNVNTNQPQEKNKAEMPLSKRNYQMIAIGVGIIIIGFLLMMGGGSDDPVNEFNYDMFSVRRIVIAPVVLLAGFMFEIWAILKKF